LSRQLANGRRPKETEHKPRKSSPGDSYFMYALGKNQDTDKSEKWPFQRLYSKFLKTG
jgi:hypothetical protein